jgi:crotonobetainyl-CoA:carnitine CoA-transferase CaiB-like acyl-CoA transferase
LAATSDVILETFRPGFLASLGLDHETLREQNSRLIMCSLTLLANKKIFWFSGIAIAGIGVVVAAIAFLTRV